MLDRGELRRPFTVPEGAAERIGLEVECGVVDPSTGRAAPYPGPRGVAALLRAVLERWGGTGCHDGPHLTGVRLADGALVSVEHGGQLEYSSAPADDLAGLLAQVRGRLGRLAALAREFGLALLPGANLPFDRVEDVAWVPTLRGPVVREFFGRIGDPGALLLTVSAQTTLDYLSEADLMRKLRMQTAASTVVAALLVNSPLYGGRAGGSLSHRCLHWQRADPRRWGVLPPALGPDPALDDVIDWALRLPMVFRRDRSGACRPAPPMPFATLLTRGFGDGTWPGPYDWTTLLAQIWTSVRLRGTLELRAADGPPYACLAAVPALWVGLSYHPPSCEAAWRLLAHHTAADHATALRSLHALGLETRLGGERMRELAAELVRLAREGLRARVAAGRERPEVPAYLDPLEEVAATGETFAQRCVRRWEAEFARRPDRYVAAYRI